MKHKNLKRTTMKHKLFQWILVAAAISFTACNEDEKPMTIPEVTTAVVTDITITSATVGGEITDDGNANVTVTGVVYSSVVGVPTLADDKIELTDTEGDFSTLLENLNSGTTYHVRAYATNSKGTGYGEVVDFTTGNALPVATNVLVTGSAEVNGQLTATYTYADAESDPQGTSTFQWYVANDGAGTGEVAIASATALTYTIQEAQNGKYIRFGVTPKATAGNLTGTEVKSAFVGAVGEATTVTFMYNGQEVTYGIINSITTRRWLDRNLGAPNVATAVNNYQNYGDMFQWGRLADGHQLIVRTGPYDADASGLNGMTLTVVPYEQSSNDTPNHPKFIAYGELPADWRNPQNSNLWQGVAGTNNPCPTGWRIPTQAEWDAENITSLADGFAKLKITMTGLRYVGDGMFYSSDTDGFYWSTTSDPADATNTMNANFNSGYSPFGSYRGNGLACRCIKD